MKKLKKLLLLFSLGVIALIAISYIHAYRFTHFSDSSKPRTDPKNLTVLDKIGLIFTGIENPHQVDLGFPASPFETFIINGNVKLESWYIPNDAAKSLFEHLNSSLSNRFRSPAFAVICIEFG